MTRKRLVDWIAIAVFLSMMVLALVILIWQLERSFILLIAPPFAWAVIRVGGMLEG